MAITTRSGKGSPLTHQEVDDNFNQLAPTGSENLFNATQEISGTRYVDSASQGAADLLVSIGVTGSIVPEGSGSWDIGTEDNPFRDLYLSSASLKLVDFTYARGHASRVTEFKKEDFDYLKRGVIPTKTETRTDAQGITANMKPGYMELLGIFAGNPLTKTMNNDTKITFSEDADRLTVTVGGKDYIAIDEDSAIFKIGPNTGSLPTVIQSPLTVNSGSTLKDTVYIATSTEDWGFDNRSSDDNNIEETNSSDVSTFISKSMYIHGDIRGINRKNGLPFSKFIGHGIGVGRNVPDGELGDTKVFISGSAEVTGAIRLPLELPIKKFGFIGSGIGVGREIPDDATDPGIWVSGSSYFTGSVLVQGDLTVRNPGAGGVGSGKLTAVTGSFTKLSIGGSDYISATSGTSGTKGTSGSSGNDGSSGTSGAGATVLDGGNNRVITYMNSNTHTAEENLTFDGSILDVTGTVSASGNFYSQQTGSFAGGVVLTSPNGTTYRLTVNNSGDLSTEAI